MTSANTNEAYIHGALYIAGFTQAGAPHVGLLLAQDETAGQLFHIRIDRATSPHWQFQRRTQGLTGDMFLSSLLRVSSSNKFNHPEAIAQIESAARSVDPPANDQFGHCGPWMFQVLNVLHEQGVVQVLDHVKLVDEADDFARNSREYARRDKFPNVSVSEFCQ